MEVPTLIQSDRYSNQCPRGYKYKNEAGVIDFDYRGNIDIVIFNHLDKPYQINTGDRIAQFIIEKICTLS